MRERDGEAKKEIKKKIEELRVKLNDKKTAKATTVQTIELTPDFMLDNTQSFLYGLHSSCLCCLLIIELNP